LNPDAIHLPEPRTPLYPLIQQRVAQAARPLADRLGAWRMMNAQGSLRTTNFTGKPVYYQAVTFDGTPRVVFWSEFFEPFMVDAAQQSFEWVIQTCRDRNLDAKEYISETMELLGLLVIKAYEEMARTDQLLRGRGYPDSVSPKPVGHKIDAMKKRIADLSAALTHRGHAQPLGQDILSLKPTLWGIGIDLKALWRRWFKRAI
jgi:hypothetical protein